MSSVAIASAVSVARPQFVRFLSAASVARKADLASFLQKEIDGIHESGLFKRERVMTTAQSAHVKTEETGERDLIMMASNNYLGLSDNKKLIEAGKHRMDTHGLGLASVRFICGTQDIHKQLEQKISAFHEKEDTILYGSCFDANGGIFEVLTNEQDALISASLNHASIIDGMRLCKKPKKAFYQHLDMDELEQRLVENEDRRIRLIVTDGVFSMDGDIAPLDKICDLADKHSRPGHPVLTFTDECHASGFLGKRGRGTPELMGVMDRIDIINGTLGKALGGSTGGYTCASKELVTLLRQRSRPYLFSNSIAPAVAGAGIELYDMLMSSNELVDKLQENTHRFRTQMKAAGFTISGHDNCPISPVMLYDAVLASKMADDLLERGVFAIAFSFPVVPKEQARIRTQLSAGLSLDDVDFAVNAFIESGKKFGVIN